MSRALRLLLAVTLLLCAAAAGFYAASRALAPERLQGQVEGWLTQATGSPAEVATLRLVFSFPIRLEGTGLRLYDGRLTVENASARIDVFSLLMGRPRLSSLRLDGAHLRLDRTPEGSWQPPLFGEPRPPDTEEPALAPLRVIEGVTRSLLSRPLLADTLIVRRSRVSLVHPGPPGSAGPVRLVFQGVNGRLMHSRLFGDARLFLRVRVESDGRERGRIEWQGSRDVGGAMRASMAATGLDLATLAPYARNARPTAQLAGTLDGVAEFRTPESGVGRLDLDLAARDLVTSLEREGGPAEPLRVPELTLRMGVLLDPERVVLSKARIGTGPLDFALDAEIARPLGDASRARVTLSLEELVLRSETARKLAEWLPETGRERVVSLMDRVRSGRLREVELRGSAPLELWGRVVRGGMERLPAGFEFALRFDDVAIDVDAANRLEGLRAGLRYTDDTLEVADAAGVLNGGPLPELSVSFVGISKLLAAPPERREMTSSAEALVGLTPLFDFLRREPDPDAPRGEPPSVDLFFEQLRHPALLWPLRNVRAQLVLRPDDDGLLMKIERAAWAGVQLDGDVDWTLRPERRLDVRLVASEPEGGIPALAAPRVDGHAGDTAQDEVQASAAAPPARDEAQASAAAPLPEPWAEGRFHVGAVSSPRWSQSGASGRFAASGGTLRVADVAIDLTPGGRLSGRVDLDLTEPDEVPYSADVNLEGADLKTLIAEGGAKGEFATGTLDVSGRIRGTLVPGLPVLHDADGSANLRARDGTIQRRVPPVFALALASTSLNPFSRRDELRFQQAAAVLSFVSGRLSTSALDIEGPDVRLFVSGSLDLSRSPHEVDAEIGLFLFRQLDRALELIPIVNVLLLGENQNLIAAYFQLSGTWEKPDVRPKPLRTLEEGPGSVLTKGIPRVMLRGMQAVGTLFRGREPEEEAVDDGAPEVEVIEPVPEVPGPEAAEAGAGPPAQGPPAEASP